MLYKDQKSASSPVRIKPVCPLRPVTRVQFDGRARQPPRVAQESLRKVTVRAAGCGDRSYSPLVSEPEDVIEVNPSPVQPGPASFFKRRSLPKCYHPNPRLYPGPKPRRTPKSREDFHQPRHRKRCLRRRLVPNARLYQPPARHVPRPSPPASPVISWQPVRHTDALKAASSVALELAAQRQSRSPNPCPSPIHRCESPPKRQRKKLKGRRRKGKCVKCKMAACPPAQSSASADDGSDGNETLSAPSEFLAEFLSAIMRREYLEALKYCRLILQYEPHNATARGFYPLLRHKLQVQTGESESEDGRVDWSPEASGSESPPSDNDHDSNKTSLPDHVRRRFMAMDHSADSSSAASAARSASGSLDASRRSSLDLDSSPESSSNELQDPTFNVRLEPADDENDNTAAGDETSRHDTARHDNQPALTTDVTETESWSSLRRLRARFAAIK